MKRPAPASSTGELCDSVRDVYAELERRPVERQCTRLTECCQFQLTGKVPHLTHAEAILAATALRATGRTRLPEAPDGRCPMLDPRNSRCLIYAARPFGCRTHFCAAAGGPYARREVADLIHRLEDLSRAAGGGEARPLPSALPAALAAVAR